MERKRDMKKRYYPEILYQLMWAFDVISKQLIESPTHQNVFKDELNSSVSMHLRIYFNDIYKVDGKIYVTKRLGKVIIDYYIKTIDDYIGLDKNTFKLLTRIMNKYFRDKIRYFKPMSIIRKPSGGFNI